MFAIIETGGKQYKVTAGETIKIEKLAADKDSKVVFDKVLLVEDSGKLTFGAPYISHAKVTGDIIEQSRTPKKIVFRYHSKTRYRKFKTHRQPFTEVKITDIK
ncbi:MAG: 50S ribosomal protein L21 [Patescibacteria group bacterium]